MRLETSPMLPTKNGVSPSVVVLPTRTGEWRTTLDFLVSRFINLSRDDIISRIKQGNICDAHGVPIAIDSPFQAQQKIYYYRAIDNEIPVPFQETVLFEDELIVVADKPHFLAVTPGGRFLQETLLVRLKRQSGVDELSPMHRIDRETAGVVMFCKVSAMRGRYQSLFEQKRVAKTYLAVAPINRQHVLPLTYRSCIKPSQHFMRMAEIEGDANCEVDITCIREGEKYALYQLVPHTGKKHQLRVQMAALGMPILNDQIYPHHVSEADEDIHKPLQLLAHKIAFTDPVSGQAREFCSERTLMHAPN